VIAKRETSSHEGDKPMTKYAYPRCFTRIAKMAATTTVVVARLCTLLRDQRRMLFLKLFGTPSRSPSTESTTRLASSGRQLWLTNPPLTLTKKGEVSIKIAEMRLTEKILRAAVRPSLTAMVLLFAVPGSNLAIASTLAATLADIDMVRLKSDLGLLTGPQEVKKIEALWLEYYKEHPPRTFGAIGQANFDGLFPVSEFAPLTVGTLGFSFIDADTLASLSSPVPIGSVLYEVNLDPANSSLYLPIGISTDASSGFSFPYTLGLNEPEFRATPFDTTGHPIFVQGIGDENVAVGYTDNILTTPEPTTLSLFAAGSLLIALGSWRTRKTGTTVK
jgi:hypothetical protein